MFSDSFLLIGCLNSSQDVSQGSVGGAAGQNASGGKLPPVEGRVGAKKKKDEKRDGKKVSAAQERLRERLKANPELAAKYRAKAAKLKAAKAAKKENSSREE